MAARIALLGDIGLFGRRITSPSARRRMFDEVAQFLRPFDVVIANLEAPFCDLRACRRKALGKSAYLRSHPDYVHVLRSLNITAVNLANNHIMDFSLDGLLSTKAALREAGISYFGCNGDEIKLSVKGETLRLLGYCSYDTNPPMFVDRHIRMFTVGQIECDLWAAAAGGQLPIVSVHFGQEHRCWPARRHVVLFRNLAERFTFVLHGHHPHVLQPIERVQGSLLCYSLGNFLFDDIRDERAGQVSLPLQPLNRIGGIVELYVDDGEIVRWGLTGLRDIGDRLVIKDRLSGIYFGRVGEAFAKDAERCYRKGDAQRRAFIRRRRRLRDVGFYCKRLRMRYALLLASGLWNRYMDRLSVPQA